MKAYASVLIAFIYKSDDLNQEKIKLIISLIKELKISNDEHNELLAEIKNDEIIYIVRGWKPVDNSSPEKHSASQQDQQLSSLSPVKSVQNPAVEPAKAASVDPLIGKKISTKRSEPDCPYYDVVITDYDPAKSSLVDLPLKNYYRYVVPSVDDFSNTDSSINGPKAFFANMPLSKTLTMNLDVPEPWLVEPVLTVHYPDNILLENLGDTRTLQAAFELEALVLTGHCSEKDRNPPRGLQLILGTKTSPHFVL